MMFAQCYIPLGKEGGEQFMSRSFEKKLTSFSASASSVKINSKFGYL